MTINKNVNHDEIKTFLFLKFGPDADYIFLLWVADKITLTREERLVLGDLLEIDDYQLLDLKALSNSEKN